MLIGAAEIAATHSVAVIGAPEKRLLPPMSDRFSAQRGTYRIIYRIDDGSRTVTVVDVDHRRDVYTAEVVPLSSTG